MPTRKIIIVTVLLAAAFFANASADEFSCTVVWAAGKYSGAGSTIGDAIDDARDNCRSDHEVTEHECGASPVNINCLDEEGQCVSHAEFLQHGLLGGDACN